MKHENALRRLKNVEGHIRGIERMVEEDTYCIDVINQIQAVQAALSKISTMILDEHYCNLYNIKYFVQTLCAYDQK
jgi:DNA-binding FrmR family transcriptional regulator